MGIRLWTTWSRTIYHLWPDEPGQIAISRFVGGRARANMFDHSTWRPLYGTLIAPIWWFTDDPTTMYRAALAVNAVLGGVSFVLLYLVARRLTAMRPIHAALSALIVCLSPMVLFTTAWVWSEALVSVLYLAALLALLRFNDSPTIARGALAGIVVIAGFAAHSRLLPLAAVLAGLVVVNVVRKRMAVWQGTAVIVVLGTSYVASSWYFRLIVDRLWEAPSTRNSFGAVRDQAFKVGQSLMSAAGQLWYQLVVTAGVFGIGTIALVGAVRRRRRDHSPSSTASASAAPTPTDALVTIAVVAPLLALSMIFMAGEVRPDRIVYGRYSDAVVGPVLLVGIGWLATKPDMSAIAARFGAVAAVTAALGVVLHALRHDELGSGLGVEPMILGLHTFIGSADSIRVPAITFAALVVIAAVAVVVLGGSALGLRGGVLAALAVLIAVAYPRTADTMMGRNTWARARTVEAVMDGILEPGDVVRYRLTASMQDRDVGLGTPKQRFLLYQFYLPDIRFEIDDGGPEDDSRFVFAPTDDAELVDQGGQLVWRDWGAAVGLWELPRTTT